MEPKSGHDPFLPGLAGQLRESGLAPSMLYEWSLVDDRLEWFGDIDAALGYAPGGFPRTIEAWRAVLHPDDRARVLEAVAAHLERGTRFLEEYRVVRRDGRVRRWVGHGTAVREGAGGPTRWIGVVTDVTEQRHAEARLRERESSFRMLFASNPHPMWVHDLDSLRFLEVNDAAVERYGYSREQFLDMRVTDLHLPEDVPRLLEQLGRGGGHLLRPVAWTHRIRDGDLIEVELQSHALELAGRGTALVVGQDVTERRRAERALRESEDRYRRLVELLPDAVGIHVDGRFVFANVALARLLGAGEPEELLSRSAMEFVHPDSRHLVAERQRALRDRGEAVPLVEERLLRLDGSTVDAEVAGAPFRHQSRPAVLLVVRDITARKRSEKLQAALYRITETAFEAASVRELYPELHRIVGGLMYARNFYIALRDPASGVLSFPYFVDEYDERPPAAEVGRTLTDYVLRTGRPLLADPETFDSLVAAGEVGSFGEPSVDWMGVPLRAGGAVFGALVVQSYSLSHRFGTADLELLNFVSQHVATAIDRQRAEEALRESEARFRAVAETAPAAIFIFQGETLVYGNDAMTRISGYPREEIVGHPFWKAIHPEFQHVVRQRGSARLRGESVPMRYELKILRKDGGERWVDFSASAIEYRGRPAALGTAFDVTERKAAEEQVRQLAYRDALTGLPNRRLFLDRLEVALAQAHRSGQRLVLLFLDLDHFKAVNDTRGHEVGDTVLRAVAERLGESVREGDTVARLGGDEFVLLLPGIVRREDGLCIAEKTLEELRRPHEVSGGSLSITASLGVAVYPDDGRGAETLLRRADAAMYRAKERGRNGYASAEPGPPDAGPGATPPDR